MEKPLQCNRIGSYNMHDLIARLEIIRKNLKLSQAEFSNLGDTKRTTYNTWIKEDKPVPSNFIFNLKQRKPQEVDLDWLFTGRAKSIFAEPLEIYHKSDCEEKLRMARQIIDTQQIAIDALKQQVSLRVS